MNEQKIKALKSKLKGMPLEFFCRLGADKRKELEIHETAKEYQDMEQAIQAFPILDIKIKLEVEGEKEILIGDILTINLELI